MSTLIKEGIKVVVITFLAIIVGVLIQLVLTDFDTLQVMLSQPQTFVEVLKDVFLGAPQGLSVFIMLIALFAFTTAFLSSVRSVIGGVEISRVEGAQKEREAEMEAMPKPEQQPRPETIIAGDNYCQICGKPISPGRAICKECEEKLRVESASFSSEG